MGSRARFAQASFGAALIAAVVVAFAPLGERCSISSAGVSYPCTRINAFDMEGVYIFVVVAVPVIVALVPSLVRHRVVSIVSACLLWIGCVIGVASIGLLFIPSAVLMTVAAIRSDPVATSPG